MAAKPVNILKKKPKKKEKEVPFGKKEPTGEMSSAMEDMMENGKSPKK